MPELLITARLDTVDVERKAADLERKLKSGGSPGGTRHQGTTAHQGGSAAVGSVRGLDAAINRFSVAVAAFSRSITMLAPALRGGAVAAGAAGAGAAGAAGAAGVGAGVGAGIVSRTPGVEVREASYKEVKKLVASTKSGENGLNKLNLNWTEEQRERCKQYNERIKEDIKKEQAKTDRQKAKEDKQIARQQRRAGRKAQAASDDATKGPRLSIIRRTDSALLKFSKALGVAGAAIATFKQSFDVGGKMFSFFTGSGRERGYGDSARRVADIKNDAATSLTMKYGTEASKLKEIERRRYQAQHRMDLYNEYMASPAGQSNLGAIMGKLGIATDNRTFDPLTGKSLLPEDHLALMENMKAAGLTSTKREDIAKFYEQALAEDIQFKHMEIDLKRKTSLDYKQRTWDTDDLTRIGGSVGGGLNLERDMANSLSSIDRSMKTVVSNTSRRREGPQFI